MASMQPSSEAKEASSKSAHLAQTLMCIRLTETNQPSAVSFEKKCDLLETSQRAFPENSLIAREALRMNLPRHLVLRSVQRRLQTIGSNYSSLKDLVADLFEQDRVPSSLDQEVPMETNQLEEAMMMSSPVVKMALRLGVPPDLITSLLRVKILSTGAPYRDVHELLADVNKN